MMKNNYFVVIQSAGSSKEKRGKGKGKKHPKDPTQPSNPKHKYYQREREKGRSQQPLLGDTSHKQRDPLFVSVSEDMEEGRQLHQQEETKGDDDVTKVEVEPKQRVENMEGDNMDTAHFSVIGMKYVYIYTIATVR